MYKVTVECPDNTTYRFDAAKMDWVRAERMIRLTRNGPLDEIDEGIRAITFRGISHNGAANRLQMEVTIKETK